MMQSDELNRMEHFRTFCINMRNRCQNINDPMIKCATASEILYFDMLIAYFDGILMGAK